MLTYIARRLLLVVPTVFLASVIVFLAVRFIPGDTVDLMVANMAVISRIDRPGLEKALGLDVPIYVQYGRWVSDIVMHGDFGDSLWTKLPVIDQIIPTLPVTFELGMLALIITQLIALPIGIYSAMRQDTIGDYIGRSIAILSIAVPNFWLATMIIVFPSLWWGYSPPVTLIHFTEDPVGNLKMFIVPGVVLGMVMSGITMRMTRTMMLEVLRQDYIRTAWSKGLRERAVILRHALRNAMIPVITVVGLQVPVLIGGAVIIEQIFCLPGMGRLILDATRQRDYPIVSGVMLLFSVAMVLINLAVDLTYAYLDPRVQL